MTYHRRLEEIFTLELRHGDDKITKLTHEINLLQVRMQNQFFARLNLTPTPIYDMICRVNYTMASMKVQRQCRIILI